MSSILKALKKLEEEKNTPHPYEFRVDSEILKGELPQKNKTFRYVMLGILLFAGGASATYFYMKQQHAIGTDKKIVQAQPPRPAQVEISPKEAPQREQELKTEVLPESVKIVPAVKQPVNPKSNGSDSKVSSSARSKNIKSKEQPKTELLNQARPATPPNSQPQAQTAGPVVPALRVNGIAHQEGASDNMAIINGVAVSDGSTVEGVKIEKIFKDRVRFNLAGEVFEIPLGRSNR